MMNRSPKNSIVCFRLLIVCAMLGMCESANANQLDGTNGLNFTGLTPAARNRVCPGGVCILSGKLSNEGDRIEEGLLVASVDTQTSRQSVLAVTIEPGREETCEIHVQLPKEIAADYVTIEVALKGTRGANEVVLTYQGKPIIDQVRLPVERAPVLTAFALHPDPPLYPRWFWPPVPDYQRLDYELAVGAQVEASLSRQTVSFRREALPLTNAEWSHLDTLMISNPRLLREAASVESAKRFLSNGGRIWIMLDRVDCELVRPLLMDQQSCEIVDEIELHDFVVDVANTKIHVNAQDRRIVSKDTLRMKRVVQFGGTVTHTVSGWPASITMDIGNGELILTTLDSRGWMEMRSEQRNPEPLYQSAYQPRRWAIPHIADEMFTSRPIELNLEESPYPLQQIGSPVVPRSWVAGLLAGFCGILAVACVWYTRSTADARLFGIWTPALAFAVGLAVCMTKAWVSADVPETIAKLQLVEVHDDGRRLFGREHSAVYLKDVKSMQLSYGVDGAARTRVDNTSGVHRFVTEGFQSWSLSNIAWPSGLWRYETQFVREANGLFASARISDQGCHLELPVSLANQGKSANSAEDLVLEFAAGHPMLCTRRSDGTFLADGKIRAGPEKWIAGTLITDEQRRRLSVYNQLFTVESERPTPRRKLYAWTGLWDGPSWSVQLPLKGAALVQLPVKIQRPEVGQQVFIPYGLVQLQQDPHQTGHTIAYDDTTGRWREELTVAVDRKFQFVLPPELTPLEADSIHFHLNIRAPHRRVTISAVDGDEEILLAELDSPSLPWVHTETDPDVLKQMQDGVLGVRLSVSDRTDIAPGVTATNIVTWHVDFFDASVHGRLQR